MKEKYYEELMEIFLGNDDLQKEHSELFNVLTLNVEHIKKTQEIERMSLCYFSMICYTVCVIR